MTTNAKVAYYAGHSAWKPQRQALALLNSGTLFQNMSFPNSLVSLRRKTRWGRVIIILSFNGFIFCSFSTSLAVVS